MSNVFKFNLSFKEHLRLPHGVEDRPILHNAEEFVGSGHVVGNGLFGIPEESVRRPNLVHHFVVQAQNFSGTIKFEPLVNPHLTEEHVHGVFLRTERNIPVCAKLISIQLQAKMCNPREPFPHEVKGEERDATHPVNS